MFPKSYERSLSFTPKFGDIEPTSAVRGESEVEDACAVWMEGRLKSQPIVWSDWPGVEWFHESVIQEMNRTGLKGFSSYPVSLIGKNGGSTSGYRGLVVSGRCGAIQSSRSRRAKSDSGKEFSYKVKGLFFQEESWDRSDVFMCDDQTAHVFFSKRAKTCLESVLSSARFESLDEIVWVSLE